MGGVTNIANTKMTKRKKRLDSDDRGMSLMHYSTMLVVPSFLQYLCTL